MPGAGEDDEWELEPYDSAKVEEEEMEMTPSEEGSDLDYDDPLVIKDEAVESYDESLDRRTKRKLDLLLLPFLALLFLLNSVDKSNIGNAETAGFTRDAGLAPNDLNVSMGYFFAFFVALQPVGAALGRKFGMVRWVPACMTLWGMCTLLHIWVRRKWQLILLRIAIAILEAGFYPTTVAYLSLFYTRYEFAMRLSFFYGQTAVAGVIGGVLSWAVFSRYENLPPPDDAAGVGPILKSWQVLFLIEGCLTIVVASIGFFWLPKSADTAWFFNAREKRWAEQRIRADYERASVGESTNTTRESLRRMSTRSNEDDTATHEREDEDNSGEAHHRLLGSAPSTIRPPRHSSLASNTSNPMTAHAGLTAQDILHAILSPKIWHILVCNILSAVPATAFAVFLPLVMNQLSPSLNLRASESNLLSAPPFAFGAIMLLIFARWSDKSKRRLIPVFWGLALLIAGLTVTVMIPMRMFILRYIALCILLSGSFIASPLTVAWLTNTPRAGQTCHPSWHQRMGKPRWSLSCCAVYSGR